MAIANGTTPLSALRKLIDLGGTCYSVFDKNWCAEEFSGTRDALLQSGVATEEMLPTGNRRRSHFPLDHNKRVVTWEQHHSVPWDSELRKASRDGCCNKGQRGAYTLRLNCSDLQISEISTVRNRYKNIENFKERVAWNLAVHLSMMRDGIRGHAEYNAENYRFSKENEILALIELIEDKLRASEIVAPKPQKAEISLLPHKRPALRLVTHAQH